MAKTPTGKPRGRPVGSKNRPKTETTNNPAPVLPTPATPTFAEALAAKLAEKPGAEVSATEAWYAANVGAVVEARLACRHLSSRDLWEVARASGLPDNVTQPAFTQRVTKERHRRDYEDMQRAAPDRPWPLEESVRDSYAEQELRKRSPKYDAMLKSQRGEAAE